MRLIVRGISRRTAAIVLLLLRFGFSASPAHAIDPSIFYPASDRDLGAIKWTGIIVNPDFGYDTLKFKGANGAPLKDGRGIRGGAELGYDYQISTVVLGAAGDFFISGIHGGDAGNSPDRLRSRLEYFGTVRGRAGFVFNRFLIFGTGGFAFSRLSMEDQTQSQRDTHAPGGTVVGGGLEWVYNKSITLRGEYQHISFADRAFATLPAAEQTLGSKMDLFKLGLISRF